MNWWAVVAGVSAALNVYLFGGLILFRSMEIGKVDHAKCIALISSVVSNKVVARVVRELADRYETIDGQAELTRIRNTVYTSDGAGQVPAIWMREQADQIERDSRIHRDWCGLDPNHRGDCGSVQ